MVNRLFATISRAYRHAMDGPPPLRDPDRVLALAYVPGARRAAVAAAFAVDERLGAIVAAAREPAIGLMRLVWWRDALEALGDGPPPAEPLLSACAEAGVDARALAETVAGWEALLDDAAIDDATVALHGCERGARLFALLGATLGAGPQDVARLAAAGEGWALADLARHLDRPARADAIRGLARAPLDRALAARWPRRLRPLGQLAALARLDLDGAASPRRRALRVLRHQLTGR